MSQSEGERLQEKQEEEQEADRQRARRQAGGAIAIYFRVRY